MTCVIIFTSAKVEKSKSKPAGVFNNKRFMVQFCGRPPGGGGALTHLRVQGQGLRQLEGGGIVFVELAKLLTLEWRREPFRERASTRHRTRLDTLAHTLRRRHTAAHSCHTPATTAGRYGDTPRRECRHSRSSASPRGILLYVVRPGT